VALAKRVATRAARACPDAATVARSVAARPAGTVYVDYLQNIVAKPVAAAYCVRATPQATVSTPLAWDELTDDLDPRAFTIATVPARLAAVGDLWMGPG
jgi:DNA primase